MLRTFVLATLVALTFAAPAHANASQTDSYAVPSGIGGAVSASCTQCFTAAGVTANVGGANFAATGGAWLHVRIADASGGPVSFSVGQDYNADGLSDLSVAYCGTEADISGAGFLASADLSVFVDITGVDCTNVATSGTITVTSA